MYKCFLLIWFVVGFVAAVKAQQPDTVTVKPRQDSVTLKHDSVKSKKFVPKITKEKVYHPDSLHDPHKALIRSLIIPGWGQLYNHRWWKLPFIYTGIGLLGDAIVFNQHYYSILLKEAYLRENGKGGRNPDLASLGDQDVYDATASYRRNRDLSILATMGAWGIQMIDAYVDAKFIRSYSMDNDLSIKVSPGVIGQPMYALNNFGSVIPAIKITFTLK